MTFLPDTNTCISLLRQKQPRLIARWQSTKVTDIVLCSVVVYELRHGAESSTDPRREHAKLEVFLSPFSSLPFDDAVRGEVRRNPPRARAQGREDRAARPSDRRHRASARLDAGHAQYR